MYNIWFDCSAVCMLVVILLAIYAKDSIPVRQNRIFALLVWVVLVSVISDLMAGAVNNMEIPLGRLSYFAGVVSNLFYFLSRNTTSFLYLLYIMSVLNLESSKKLQKACLYAPFLTELVLIGLTPFFGWVFSLDGKGVYSRGPLLPVLYMISLSYLAAAVYFIATYRKLIPFTRRAAFYSFAVIVLITVVIQGLIPTVLIEGFGTALCIFLIYTTIQRPEELQDGQSGLLNKPAFLTMVSMKLQQKSEFDMIVIAMDKVAFLEKSLSVHMITKLIADVGAWMRKNVKKMTAYRVADRQICLISQNCDPVYLEELTAILMERFNQAWTVEGLSVSLPSYFMQIHCPSDASNMEQLLDLIEMTSGEHDCTASVLLRAAEMDVKTKQRQRKLRQILEEALPGGMLEVYYQPIYSVASGRFVSAEALLRLRHPELGFIPPDEFIPIAEESGIIISFGQFVLDSVCRFMSENRLEQYGIQYVDVNLSAVECLQDDLVENVLETLDRYHIKPGQINLEITETAMNTMSETVLHKLERLSRHGVRFSLDDYGTGYSNIARMVAMPLDVIKIDKSLVQNMFTAEVSNPMHIVLENTLQMLRELGKSALVEGIETKEQSERVIRMGCQAIQGFYYARPVPGEEFLRTVRVKKEQ